MTLYRLPDYQSGFESIGRSLLLIYKSARYLQWRFNAIGLLVQENKVLNKSDLFFDETNLCSKLTKISSN